MDILLWVLLLAVSLTVLIKGSDWFVDAAEKIGLSLGISSYVIGVTVVAIGTSLPELASSIASIYKNESAIVTGNVVGSNITNVLLILGVVAFFSRAIIVSKGIVEREMPLLLLSAFLFYFMISDGNFSIIEAVICLLGLALFVYSTITGDDEVADVLEKPELRTRHILFLILGATCVYFGAEYTVVAVSKISKFLSIPSDFIAVTVVALGTSLPELVVSLNASRKGNTGIAIGNVVGSNIFNTFAVMGIARMFGNFVIPVNILGFGLTFMVAVTIILAIISFSNKITRIEGGMLLVFYFFFVLQLSQNVI